MPTSRPASETSPLLSQTAAGHRPGGKPWESQPEGGRRFTSQPDQRPPDATSLSPPQPASPIQVGGSFRDPAGNAVELQEWRLHAGLLRLPAATTLAATDRVLSDSDILERFRVLYA